MIHIVWQLLGVNKQGLQVRQLKGAASSTFKGGCWYTQVQALHHSDQRRAVPAQYMMLPDCAANVDHIVLLWLLHRPQQELESCRQRVLCVALAWPETAFMLVDVNSNNCLLSLSKVCTFVW